MYVLTFPAWYWVYQQEVSKRIQEREYNPLCKDTPTHTAWLAWNKGEPRCFMEQNDYPHRAKGSNVNEDSTH